MSPRGAIVAETHPVLLFHPMSVITGGRTATTDGGGRRSRGAAGPSHADRIVTALLHCIGRWGPDKTTVDDVARAAGVSRATVYRIFPGGKPAMMQAALQAEVARLVATMSDDLERAADLEDCLAVAISSATAFLRSSDALEFLREHQYEGVETLFAFDRLDGLLSIAANVLGPLLAPHVEDPDVAAEVAVWGARVVVSYLGAPDGGPDLAREADARHLVRTYLMPGLAPADTHRGPSAVPAPSAPSTNPTT